MIPQWLARRVAQRVREDPDYVAQWHVDNGPVIVTGVVKGIEAAGYRVVMTDPNTEPGERPIVVREIHWQDLEGLKLHPDDLWELIP